MARSLGRVRCQCLGVALVALSAIPGCSRHQGPPSSDADGGDSASNAPGNVARVQCPSEDTNRRMMLALRRVADGLKCKEAESWNDCSSCSRAQRGFEALRKSDKVDCNGREFRFECLPAHDLRSGRRRAESTGAASVKWGWQLIAADGQHASQEFDAID